VVKNERGGEEKEGDTETQKYVIVGKSHAAGVGLWSYKHGSCAPALLITD
jgi:hypothetical protein